MNSRTQNAQLAKDALASVRAQNPQLGKKLHMATGAEAGQLALFPSAQQARTTDPSRGLKDHEWDRQNPISKTDFAVVLYCQRCKVRMKLQRGSSPQYRVKTQKGDGPPLLVWSSIRPVCIPKETPYGPPTP